MYKKKEISRQLDTILQQNFLLPEKLHLFHNPQEYQFIILDIK